jgi:hypothetical protein
MTARTLNNVVNDQTVALNALIYGYGGHSLVTPQYALQQIWWTEERIDEKVNEDYVNSRLQPKEREWLSRPVGFGDLTDDTYLEWILEKARRLFLILVEIGEADRIFAVVEKSWDDDDLPLSMDDIEQLALANRRDDQANIRFYQTQFSFLLRVLGPGLHARALAQKAPRSIGQEKIPTGQRRVYLCLRGRLHHGRRKRADGRA